ncbi:glutamyl-tRNA(Gln) amidotransferase subunit D [Candidatus Caldarchaeum subterraneum]|uniref:Glutamyl-tRNA(Gln) amidotransferase subunit D n=1 Tax=Caldiarchaeum subterraneum TaxID=311458 RepID=E6N9R3_CALS0|nr:glutamyl-tRNA(Gln) amidotransferase subunit D [Candidatus Caldarchaeum subterraneum]BAJ49069.1 glutamyl-tRNA(Gln) amidotransferase subunit D [Candidatus Caldarchaeum subterraneum]BAJ49987.1 glutamyl-tRNA(Gln) amidotransferase subunit D [Candidatus Caldarchaeum subterraneum]
MVTGYGGLAAEVLRGLGVGLGDEVEVVRNGLRLHGFVMARYEFGEPDVLVLKLPNGYNMGVRVDAST